RGARSDRDGAVEGTMKETQKESAMRRAVVAIAMTLVIVGESFAAIIHVPADQSTIQAAINAAAPAGDTIIVAAGTYTGNVTINKSVTLLGANAGRHPAVGTHPTAPVGARGAETILASGFYALSPAADN